jgi:hypothetical protein
MNDYSGVSKEETWSDAPMWHYSVPQHAAAGAGADNGWGAVGACATMSPRAQASAQQSADAN